jgi:hypothetical protein
MLVAIVLRGSNDFFLVDESEIIRLLDAATDITSPKETIKSASRAEYIVRRSKPFVCLGQNAIHPSSVSSLRAFPQSGNSITAFWVIARERSSN